MYIHTMWKSRKGDKDMTEFYGYRRAEGRPGIRNYVLILPTSVCASDVANIIAGQVDGNERYKFDLGMFIEDPCYIFDLMKFRWDDAEKIGIYSKTIHKKYTA